jgi:PAS domain S-box-containing protein
VSHAELSGALAAELTAQPISVLLIEDDLVDEMATLRAVTSRAWPYQMQIARSVAQARALLARHSFDVILADYQLSDGTSFDLLDDFADTLVVFITGAWDAAAAARALRLGVHDYLIKDTEGNYLELLNYRVQAGLTQRRTERQLRDSEARLKAILDNAPASISAHDLSGRLILSNRRHDDLGPQTAATGPDTGPLCEATEREEVRTGPDGRVQTYLTAHFPIPDADGQIQAMGAISLDITLRKHQEEALRRSREFMDRAGSMAGVGGWGLDLRTMRVDWSDEVCRIHGVDAGFTPSYEQAVSFYAPDSRPRISAAVAQAMTDGSTFDLELQIVRADGVLCWVHTVGTVDFEDEHPVRLVGAFQDISETVARRQDLQRAQQRVALATAAGGIGIWEWDLLDNALSWDPLMHRLYGLATPELPVDYSVWRNSVHPQDLPAAEAWLQAAMEGDEAREHEFRIVWADGSVHFMSGSTQVVRDLQGRPVRMVGVNRDVTELTRSQAELRRSNAELEQFAYVASHDLQEPLRMVANYTELLAQRYQGQLDERADKYIHYAVDGAHRMQGLVNDLLAYSRVGAQGKPLQAIALDPVVDTVMHALKGVIDEAGAVIERRPLPAVMGDATQLHQLFQNLISNALKFRSAAPVRIELAATPAADHWLFSVRDNGIGIDMRYAERVFQMFQRLHERGKYDGSGIGLAITKRIVERHEGTIWFESAPGAGTTFFFTLRAA